MVAAAWGGTEDADLIALVVDAKGGLGRQGRRAIAESARRPAASRKFLILNKVDLADKEKLLRPCRAAERAGRVRRDVLRQRRDRRRRARSQGARSPRAMPEGPWHYPEDQVSDATERMIAAEVTREQLYLQLHAELPYASAVETENYRGAQGRLGRDPPADPGRAPDSQKAIVLGKGGARIKAIGARARAELRELLGRPVHLYLHVKVKPDGTRTASSTGRSGWTGSTDRIAAKLTPG